MICHRAQPSSGRLPSPLRGRAIQWLLQRFGRSQRQPVNWTILVSPLRGCPNLMGGPAGDYHSGRGFNLLQFLQ